MELIDAAIVRVPAALNRSSLASLRDALASASRDAHVRAVVLRGADAGVFCRGVDFAAIAAGEDPTAAVDAFAGCLLEIRACAKPVVALVEGEAAGGGLGVAAAADAVLAVPDASFALPELLFGLTPAMILPYLAERVTPQKLRWLALCPERIDADAAQRIGLVDRVEPPERCDATIRSWLVRLRRTRPAACDAWKQMTMIPPALGSAEGAQRTLDTLRNAQIADRIRRFIDDGEPPWAVEER